MLTCPALGSDGALVDAHHLMGALVLTTTAIACAEVRFVNWVWAVALLGLPLVFEATVAEQVATAASSLALLGLSVPKGRIRQSYGEWNRSIV
jgi:hypothetical protein